MTIRESITPAPVASFTSLSLPRAILFDMDGILVDSEELHWQSVNDVLKSHLGSAAPLLEQRIGWGDDELWSELKKHYTLAGTPMSLTAERGALAIKALIERPPPPMTGAIEAISAFKKASPELILAVVSASPKDQMIHSLREFVDHEGSSLFDELFSGVDDAHRNKPFPDPYLVAMKHYKVSPAECWITEDSSTGLTAALATEANVFAVGAYTATPALVMSCAQEMNTLLNLFDLWKELRYLLEIQQRQKGNKEKDND